MPLLVVLASAELVQQIERRRRVVMQGEERVPAVLALHRTLTHDDGADGLRDAADRGGRLGNLDLLGLGALVATGLLVLGELRARQSLPPVGVAAATRRADQEHGLAEAVETAKSVVGEGGSGVEDDAKLTELDAPAQRADEGDGSIDELGIAGGDDESEKAARLGPVQVEELLGAHFLVADGVEALRDLELAREAGDGVVVDAQCRHPVAQRAQGLGGPHELLDPIGLHRAHQPPEARARHDLLAAGQDGEAQIVERLEVEDALDAQGRAEEQRQREAPRLVGAAQRLGQRPLRDAAQGERGRQEEEGAPEVGAPDQVGRGGSPSSVRPRS